MILLALPVSGAILCLHTWNFLVAAVTGRSRQREVS
jgi:hypothetical protein